jgi:hypothetical protein
MTTIGNTTRLCKVIEDVEKNMQNKRNRVPVKVMKAYVVHRSSVEVAHTLLG